MAADETLSCIRVKIERAQKHLDDLKSEIRSFFAINPYKVGTKRDPQTRKLIYYMVSTHETPITIAAIAGDVLQNLRSTLDHLAYQLVISGGGTPSKQTSFPITDDAIKYSKHKPSRIKGMHPSAIKTIDAIKPYKGGNDLLWRLHQLNIIDKHRFVITVGSAFRSFNLGDYMHQDIQGMLSEMDMPFQGIDLYVKPADRLFPLKAGDEIFTDKPDAEIKENMQFRFDIAFGEPGIVEGESLIETLQQMIYLVDKIVISFKPMLA